MSFIPRPEHPQPNFRRDAWLNLNGQWRFAFDPHNVGEPERWYMAQPARSGRLLPGTQPKDKPMTITVPYPWESRLSGVAATEYKGAAWYEREFTVPAEWAGQRPYLHFGAVDWLARVWVNGRLVAEHENGYLPFSVDLSPYVAPGERATVIVRAYDIADAATLLGKQVPRWYTYSSGIWQTVWLEARPASHIEALRVEPQVANQQAIVHLTLSIAVAGEYRLRLRSTRDAFAPVEEQRQLGAGSQQLALSISIPDPQLWSPESPYLYDFVAELEAAAGDPADRVQSYFGMRTVERGQWNGRDYEYILLNGEPVYLRGALDQAFYPESLHAYPSDDAIRADIELARDLGLNMLRCHIKINDPRYYYWADRLGMLIMYDLPSPDLDSPAMRRTFEATLYRAVERDYNSPSIFAWILFNETWGLTKHNTLEGQRWLQQMLHLARQLDPSRLIEENSVCRYDHVETDINSWHFYINDYWRARQHIQRVVDESYPGSEFNYVGGEFVQERAPLMNSEYAGISARSGDLDVAWSFKYLTNELRRHDKICGYVYTELADIEWEHNGFVDYDRSPKEFGYDHFVAGMAVRDLTGADFVGYDAPPCQTLPPQSDLNASLFVSHWGTPLGKAEVRWQLDFVDGFGQRRSLDKGAVEVQPSRFAVTDLTPLHLRMPAEPGLATLAFTLVDDSGVARARNYFNVEVRDQASPRLERREDRWILRFAPGHFSRTSFAWPVPFVSTEFDKFSAQGSGWIEYDLPLPEGLDLATLRRLRLLCEISARAGLAKVDWPQRLNGVNYPQTEPDKRYPTDVTIRINGVEIGHVHLPDDPADARGMLSHHREIDPGAYGYLSEVAVEDAQLDAVLVAARESGRLQVQLAVPADARHPGGLAIYGETVGCYPLDPTLILEVAA
jgi:hypothetical protein